jgi:GNAT superfamily N-acetyltransferase
MKLLRLRGVWTTNLCAALIGFGMFGSFILIPQFVQAPEGAGYGFAADVTGASISRVLDPALNRDLYARVGERWSWTDKLPWTDDQWAGWSKRVETWVASVGGRTAGYYELDPGPEGRVEIAIFGLLPGFEGRGLGGWLLTHALRRGFELGRRVWVHTCSLDAPGALPNYLARGMRVVERRAAC